MLFLLLLNIPVLAMATPSRLDQPLALVVAHAPAAARASLEELCHLRHVDMRTTPAQTFMSEAFLDVPPGGEREAFRAAMADAGLPTGLTRDEIARFEASPDDTLFTPVYRVQGLPPQWSDRNLYPRQIYTVIDFVRADRGATPASWAHLKDIAPTDLIPAFETHLNRRMAEINLKKLATWPPHDPELLRALNLARGLLPRVPIPPGQIKFLRDLQSEAFYAVVEYHAAGAAWRFGHQMAHHGIPVNLNPTDLELFAREPRSLLFTSLLDLNQDDPEPESSPINTVVHKVRPLYTVLDVVKMLKGELRIVKGALPAESTLEPLGRLVENHLGFKIAAINLRHPVVDQSIEDVCDAYLEGLPTKDLIKKLTKALQKHFPD